MSESTSESTASEPAASESASLSAELRASVQEIWDAQLEHPFVRGIADGTLDEDVFANWVRQDYLYLKDFARIFAWAVAKSDRLESMSWFATVLDMTLNTEMALHRSYAERFGIDRDALEAEEMWPTTRAYTDFLVRVSADGDMADLLAALLPCAWGYLYVAREMASWGVSPDARYADWVEMYTSEEFAEAADWLKGELDRVAAGATEEKKARLQEIFTVSSRYEWAFWEMCWTGETWGPEAGRA